MSEFKPGDRVWTIDEVVSQSADGVLLGLGPDEYGRAQSWVIRGFAIPDHPALPAVARWLSETPEAVVHLKIAVGHLRTYGFLNDGSQAAMESLLAALEAGS